MIIYKKQPAEELWSNKTLNFNCFNEYIDNQLNIISRNDQVFCTVYNIDNRRFEPSCAKLFFNNIYINLISMCGIQGCYAPTVSRTYYHKYFATPFSGEFYSWAEGCFTTSTKASYNESFRYYPFNFIKYKQDSNFAINFYIDLITCNSTGLSGGNNVCASYNHYLKINNDVVVCYDAYCCRCGFCSCCYVCINCDYVCDVTLTLCRCNNTNLIFLNGVNTNCDNFLITMITSSGGSCCYCHYSNDCFYPKKIEVISGNVKYLNMWSK